MQNQRGTISTHLDLDATPDHFNTFWFGRKTSDLVKHNTIQLWELTDVILDTLQDRCWQRSQLGHIAADFPEKKKLLK